MDNLFVTLLGQLLNQTGLMSISLGNIIMIIVGAILAFQSPFFLSIQNVLNMGLAGSVTGVMAEASSPPTRSSPRSRR